MKTFGDILETFRGRMDIAIDDGSDYWFPESLIDWHNENCADGNLLDNEAFLNAEGITLVCISGYHHFHADYKVLHGTWTCDDEFIDETYISKTGSIK